MWNIISQFHFCISVARIWMSLVLGKYMYMYKLLTFIFKIHNSKAVLVSAAPHCYPGLIIM